MSDRNPEYTKLLKKMQETHDKKSHDYASDTNVFSNFEFAGMVQDLFTDKTDKAFAVLVGVKLARLGQLLSGKTPNNESIEDTFLDLANYCAIWGSVHMKGTQKNQSAQPSQGLSQKLRRKCINCGANAFATKDDRNWYCENCIDMTMRG